MLSQEQIQQALHAGRVVPLGVVPQGPFGLEHLAEVVARLQNGGRAEGGARVERPVALPVETWRKLDELARTASRNTPQPVAASEMAAAILAQAVAAASGS